MLAHPKTYVMTPDLSAKIRSALDAVTDPEVKEAGEALYAAKMEEIEKRKPGARSR
jgi:hypothetical protein